MGHAMEEEKPNKLRYTPSTGSYPFFHKGKLFFFHRQSERHASFPDRLWLSCFGRNPSALKKLMEECRTHQNRKDVGKTVIYHPKLKFTEGSWIRGMVRAKRDIATVVLDAEVKESIMKDLAKYFDIRQQQWYSARGIPYRRGYLLHGPPGTGKSSLSYAIAGHFDLKIYVVNLNSSNLNEDILTQLFSLLPQKCLVLLEDVDAAGITQQRTASSITAPRDKQNISLSGLLNVIDGVASQEGRVLIMTTNHMEMLDSALIRPGRVDMTIQFTNASQDQLAYIFESIYRNMESSESGDQEPLDSEVDIESEDTSIANDVHLERISTLARQFAQDVPHDVFSPAEIQGYLLTWKDDPEIAVEKAAEWAKKAIAAKDAAAAALKAEEEEAEAKKADKKQAEFNNKLERRKAVNELLREEEATLQKNAITSPNTNGNSSSNSHNQTINDNITTIKQLLRSLEASAVSGSKEVDTSPQSTEKVLDNVLSSLRRSMTNSGAMDFTSESVSQTIENGSKAITIEQQPEQSTNEGSSQPSELNESSAAAQNQET